jgi:hypothetical protein
VIDDNDAEEEKKVSAEPSNLEFDKQKDPGSLQADYKPSVKNQFKELTKEDRSYSLNKSLVDKTTEPDYKERTTSSKRAKVMDAWNKDANRDYGNNLDMLLMNAEPR